MPNTMGQKTGLSNLSLRYRYWYNEWVEYLNVLNEFQFVSLINNFTRVTESKKTCLDHIFVRTKLNTDLLLPIIIEQNSQITINLQIVFDMGMEKTERYVYNTTAVDYNKLKLNLQTFNGNHYITELLWNLQGIPFW